MLKTEVKREYALQGTLRANLKYLSADEKNMFASKNVSVDFPQQCHPERDPELDKNRSLFFPCIFASIGSNGGVMVVRRATIAHSIMKPAC